MAAGGKKRSRKDQGAAGKGEDQPVTKKGRTSETKAKENGNAAVGKGELVVDQKSMLAYRFR